MSQSCNLPTEIFFDIGGYLNRPQLIDCALVCKSWHVAFGPLIWSRLELGSNKSITQLTAEELCAKASWIRSLVFEDAESIIRYSVLGKKRIHLRSLTITNTRYTYALGKDHWNAYKDLIKPNRRTLVSLALINTPFNNSKSKYGYPTWSPLVSIAQYPHSNLRALRLEQCYLPCQHLYAFWDICERLEVLELKGVPFELPPLNRIRRTARCNSGSKHQDKIVRFSNLLELTLGNSGPKNSLTTLERIIRQAPKLKKLYWDVRRNSWLPVTRFMYLFSGQATYHRTPAPECAQFCIPLAPCATPCWPNIESLAIGKKSTVVFQPHDYQLIVEICNQLCVLELPLYQLNPTILDTLLRLHSHTLTVINWRDVYIEETFSCIQGVLLNCSRLAKAIFPPIYAQDLVTMGDTWACCNSLEELRVFIDMDPHADNPPRPIATELEIRKISLAVFTQLGKLRRLRVLDMRDSHKLSSLKFNMSMGLEQLSNWGEFEELRYQGCQDLTPQDLNWMIDHWKSLKIIGGKERLSRIRAQHVRETKQWSDALTILLNKYYIKVIRTSRPENNLEDIEIDWECPWTKAVRVKA